MKTILNLQDCPHTRKYLAVEEGEYCGLISDIEDLTDMLPIVISRIEDDGDMLDVGKIMSYVINHLFEMQKELEKGGATQ